MHIHLPFRNPHRYLGLCAYNHRSESTNLEDLRVSFSFCLFSHTISTGINDKWPRLCVFFIFQGISRLICNISKTSYSYSFSNNHNLNQIYHLRILPSSHPFQKLFISLRLHHNHLHSPIPCPAIPFYTYSAPFLIWHFEQGPP